jgi:hypothetical protein
VAKVPLGDTLTPHYSPDLEAKSHGYVERRPIRSTTAN